MNLLFEWAIGYLNTAIVMRVRIEIDILIIPDFNRFFENKFEVFPELIRVSNGKGHDMGQLM